MRFTIIQATTRNKFPMDIVARAIKFFQKTNYSHYAIEVIDPTTKEVYYYDSTGAGTRKSSLSTFNKKYSICKRFKVKKEMSYIEWLEFWSLHANKGYGFGQILGLLVKGFRILRHNPLGQGAKRLICNELVILLLNHLDYTNIKDTDSLDLVETEEILNKVLP